MRILFKTSYLDDIRLFRHGGNIFWYGLLAVCLLLAPAVLREFYVGELSQVFILAIAGVGLMLLIGYTGLASLGHGAASTASPSRLYQSTWPPCWNRRMSSR